MEAKSKGVKTPCAIWAPRSAFRRCRVSIVQLVPFSIVSMVESREVEGVTSTPPATPLRHQPARQFARNVSLLVPVGSTVTDGEIDHTP
jgi:hypothetical protein